MNIELKGYDKLPWVLDNSVELIIGSMSNPLTPAVWAELQRIVKPHGIICVTSHGAIDFVEAHRKHWRHSWGPKEMRCSVWCGGVPRYNHTSEVASKHYPIEIPCCRGLYEVQEYMVELCTNKDDCVLKFNYKSTGYGALQWPDRSTIMVSES